ncbi:beta strand repeat-containing protein [Bradyrhizobium sp. AZCC 1721]|uniref:beta strand repeat-containing protein n=1 Tax=Bradyrhizobium sp. AZCC 1721 TaxID=3117016 RepID=UPI002FEE69F1
MAVQFIGSEFLVNTTTAGNQVDPTITVLADGRFVVAWADASRTGGDTDGDALRAQMFNADGSLSGSEFLVNTTTASNQFDPSITALADGRFVIAWTDNSPGQTLYAVRAQIFNVNGSPSGSEFLVNSTAASQRDPAITALPGGRFVVAWVDVSSGSGYWAVRAQVFNADGTPSGSELLVTTSTARVQDLPTITALADGRFVVAWTDLSQTGGDTSGTAVRAQVFNADGTPSGSEFLVNTTTASSQVAFTITALAGGRFVVAWTDFSQTGGDTSSAAVRAQVFNADGTPFGSELLVNTTTTSHQESPTISALADGRFVVVWTDLSQTGGDTSGAAVRAQVFNADGTPSGSEFLVNTTTISDQAGPTITSLSDGRFVIAWSDRSQTGDDTSLIAVRAQIFEVVPDNQAPAITSDGGGDDAFITLAENTTTVTTVTATDPDAGQTLTYAIAGGADAGLFTIDASTGAVSFNAAPDFEASADAGSDNVYDVTVQVSDGNGGIDTQAIAVTVTNANEAPVITTPPVVGAVQEDVTLSISGTMAATDEDAGAIQLWSVVGGNAASGADYTFSMDSLNIAKNGATIFTDEFDDGTPPPSVPAGSSPPSYGVNGTFTENGGRLFMDDSGAVPSVGVGTPDPFVGQFATLRTNIDPANLAQGLKSDDDFTVEGRFDLILPDSSREAYGIRLSDRLQGGSGTPPDQRGDDAIELVVRRALNGVVIAQLLELDFAADTVTIIQSILLNPPPGADQIVLRLSHSTADVGAIQASFDYLAGGVVVGTQSFSEIGRIFGTETPGFTGDDENWTLAQIVSYAPQITDSALTGIYGTLNINQAGQWTYNLDNGQANVQALAAGETVKDDFTIRVSDGAGGIDTETVSITVTGTNDAPTDVALAGDTVVENAAAGTVVGTLSATDVDNDDTTSFDLVDDAGGRFAFANGNQIVATGTGLDFESATSHDLIVRVTDLGGLTREETFTIAVSDVTESTAPAITSDGGSDTAAVSVAENTIAVTTVTATDPDAGQTLSYTIVGGVDASLFTVDANTGALAFVTAPDFEAPANAGTNNVYDVTVQVSDGYGGTDTQAIAVTVGNVNEAPTFVGDSMTTTAIGPGDDFGRGVAIQPDGKILVAGSSFNGTGIDFALVRYEIDGHVDTSFGGDGKVITDFGGADGNGYSVVVDPSGKILVAGYTGSGAESDFAIVRYNADGSLDTSFGDGGKVITDLLVDDFGQSVGLQPDGKIVVSGYSFNANISGFDFALVRYNADGSLDFSFNGDGRVTTRIGTHEASYSVVVQPDGKILAAGHSLFFGTNDIAVVRYNADGSLDTDFGEDGRVTTDFGHTNDVGQSVAVQADGRIVVAGISQGDIAVVRYNADGSLDTSFGDGGRVTTSIAAGNDVGSSVTIQADGRILVAGSSFNGANTDFAIVRYNTDGSLDTSFGDGGKLTTQIGAGSDEGYSVKLQPDGRILLAGYSSNGVNADFALVRYNTDGSLDSTFGTPDVMAISIAENTASATTFVASDPDAGQALTYAIAGGADAGQFEIDANTGALSFVSAPNFEAPADAGSNNVYNLTISVSDGSGATDTQALAITVTNVSGSIVGDAGDNNLVGTNEEDTISGLAGNDTLDGRGGVDSLLGGEGDDTLLAIAGDVVGGEIYDGGGGLDTLQIAGFMEFEGVTLNSIEALTYTSGFDSPSFTSDHLGAGLSPNLVVTGNAGFAVLSIGGPVVDISGWTFLNWNPSKQIFLGGTIGDDTISGSAQDEYLGGGMGQDYLSGGDGTDIFRIFQAGEVVAGETYDGGAGFDIIRIQHAEPAPTDFSGTTIASIEALTFLGGSATNTVVFNSDQIGEAALSALIVSGKPAAYGRSTDAVAINMTPSGSLDLSGWSFADWNTGEDTVTVNGSAGADTVTGSSQSDVIGGQGGDDILVGNSGDDTLEGSAGIDNIDGGTDIDTAVYSGMRANYSIELNGDGSVTITDLRAGSPDATDTVRNVEFFAFADGIIPAAQLINQSPFITSDGGGETAARVVSENVTVVTTVVATDPDPGQTLTYTIGGGADAGLFQIDGSSGALSFVTAPDFETPSDAGTDNVYDVIVQVSDSNGGMDTQAIAVTVQNTAGTSLTGNGAANTLTGTAEEDTLNGQGGNDTLLGLTGNDVLIGGAGADVLDGGTGRDTMTGGAGNDGYVVDSSEDIVVENAGEGTDTIRTALAVFALAGIANVENLTFVGSGDFTGTGNALANSITGGAGNDTLDGAGGVDRLVGLGGNDTYSVDNQSDVVVEVANAGTDTVMAASAAYTLSASTENLTYVGTGNFNGTGNGLANTIAGGGNADTLSGAGGNDTIVGLGGNDILGGGAGDDTFIATAGDGNDGYAGNGGSDTYSLAGLAADATINLVTGTASSSEIGTDTLTTIENVVGGSGQDTITASNAHNTFSGGTGNDTFVFASTNAAGIDANRDIITDFVPAADRFDLSGIDANGGQAGNPEFVFVGELINVVGGVGQLGRGQLGYHYETDANGIEHTIVEGSIDADAAAEFQIDLVGRHILSAGDFIL